MMQVLPLREAAMFERLGAAVTRRPWWVIAGWLAAAAAIVLLAPGLGGVTNADQAAFLPSGAESARAATLATRDLPGPSRVTAVVVVTRPGATLSAGDTATIARLADLPKPAGVTGIAFDPPTGAPADRRV